MAKSAKSKPKQRPTGYDTPVKIEWEFLEVFKVVKKNKEDKAKNPKKG